MRTKITSQRHNSVRAPSISLYTPVSNLLSTAMSQTFHQRLKITQQTSHRETQLVAPEVYSPTREISMGYMVTEKSINE